MTPLYVSLGVILLLVFLVAVALVIFSFGLKQYDRGYRAGLEDRKEIDIHAKAVTQHTPKSPKCEYCEQGYLKMGTVHYDEGGFLGECGVMDKKEKSQ